MNDSSAGEQGQGDDSSAAEQRRVHDSSAGEQGQGDDSSAAEQRRGHQSDLTPRAAEETPGARSTSTARRLRSGLLIGVVLVALGFVVFRGLGNATVYFRNADEAVAQREELGNRRFRLQGAVVPDSVTINEVGVSFQVAFNSVTVDVDHVGDPPELFQPDIPVVLEGRWSDDVFASDRILIKHTEVYEEENPDRVSYTDGVVNEQTSGSGS